MKNFAIRFASMESLWRAATFGSVAFFIVTGLVVSDRIAFIGEEAAWVNHTNQVINTLGEIKRSLLEIETGQRGFLLTGNASFIDAYKESQGEVSKSILELQDLIQDNEEQLSAFDQLKELAKAREDSIEEVLLLWEKGEKDRAIGIISIGKQNRVNSIIAEKIEEMAEVESRLLKDRIRSFNSTRKATKWLVWSAVGVVIGFMFLVMLLVKRMKESEKRLDDSESRLNLVNESLQASEQQFITMADMVPQFLWIASPEGVPTYFNQRWYEFTGMSPNDPKEKWINSIHPGDQAKTREVWFQAVSTGSQYEIEYRILSKDGTPRWYIGRALPLKNQSGQIVNWFGTCTDINDSKENEQNRENMLSSERGAREAMERANNTKDEFVATLSHELRGPLNAIMGWLQILNNKKDDQALLHRGLEVISSNVKLQTQLISDLFDFHRVNKGKLSLSLNRVRLDGIVLSSTYSIRPICERKNIDLEVNIHPADPAEEYEVLGDPLRLSQVLGNLFSNSLKFTPAGGRICVSLAVQEDSYLISIEDTGRGISEKMLPVVFDRYKQGDAAKRHAEGGLGLGLSIVKSFVELHGGKITAASEGLGKGAVFKIILPKFVEQAGKRDDTNIEGKLAESYLAGGLEKLHILLLEDQSDAREAIKRILSDRGAVVVDFGTAEEALKWLAINRVNCIVSDISLPNMDGFAFIRKAHQLHENLNAVALTAFSREDDQIRAKDAGFSRYLVKPVDATQLISTVKELCSEDSFLTRDILM